MVMMNFCKQSCFLNVKLIAYFVLLSLKPSSTSSYDAEDTVVDQLRQLKLDQEELNRRVGFLENDNKEQKEDIQFLLSIQLSKIKQNEQSGSIDNFMANTSWQERVKRPVRLFPENLLRNKKKEEEKPVIGPPSSCEEISKMGHTLSSIYMIKGSNGSKINVVFCNFQTDETRMFSSSPYAKFMENKLGYIDVKSASGVYFYVQASGYQPMAGIAGVIRFDKERLNIGAGMNWKTGVFTAPKTGTYSFLFTIVKNRYHFDFLDVYFRLNGTQIGYSLASPGLISIPATLHSTLKLNRGDRIDVYKGTNGKLYECSNGYCHHFTGWLLEEDLEL